MSATITVEIKGTKHFFGERNEGKQCAPKLSLFGDHLKKSLQKNVHDFDE